MNSDDLKFNSMSKTSIKCEQCDHWNFIGNKDKLNCENCGHKLHNHQHKSWVNSESNQLSFIESLPPYAKYIFIGLISIIAGLIVVAVA